MKKAILAALCAATLAQASPSPVADVVRDFPGYGIDNQCLPFARSAAAYLTLRGYKARIVSFRFREQPEPVAFSLTSYAPTPEGRVIHHAIVIFDAPNGRFWLDNFYVSPRKCGQLWESYAACVDRAFPNFIALTTTPKN